MTSNLKVSFVKNFRNWQLHSLTFFVSHFYVNCSSGFNLKLATHNFNIKTCNLQFCWNLQLLTCYSFFRYLICSTANILPVEAGRISEVLNTSGVTRNITLDTMSFDTIGNTTGLLHKIKFCCVFGKIFFLTESFPSSRKLWDVSKFS